MKQHQFEHAFQGEWLAFEALLTQIEKPGKSSLSQSLNEADFSQKYRRICHFLAIAKQRNYSTYLVEQLNDLVLRGHQQLYQSKTSSSISLTRFILYDFPNSVRLESRFVWVSVVCFYAPLIIMGLVIYYQPDMIYTLMDQQQVNEMASMYDPENQRFGIGARQPDGDFAMFGYYIWNNVSIGFQTFASGLFFCVGSLFYLIFNGLFIGSIAGYLTQLGYINTFYTFVVGHSALELTAIVLSGAAGLKLGYALISPGNKLRKYSLQQAARQCVPLIYGITIMLVLAAFIEAFWSSKSHMAPEIKYLFGGVNWLLIILYFCLSGRYSRAIESD